MSDLVLQNYRREIERQGASPISVAVGLLGLPVGSEDRFLLLCPALAGDPDHVVIGPPGSHYASHPMTGVTGLTDSGEEWTALHAFAVFTLIQSVGLMRLLNMRGQACTLWDTVMASRATGDGHPWLRVEEGWRNAKNGRRRLGRATELLPVSAPLRIAAAPTFVSYGGRHFSVMDPPTFLPFLPSEKSALVVTVRIPAVIFSDEGLRQRLETPSLELELAWTENGERHFMNGVASTTRTAADGAAYVLWRVEVWRVEVATTRPTS